MTVQVTEGDAEVKVTVSQESEGKTPKAVVSGKPALQFDEFHPPFIVSFVCIMLITLFAGLNSTILTTSIPHLIEQFGHSESGSWIINAYLLATLIFIPITGHLSELMGRKLLLIISISIFTLGSALCAISWNMYSLIIFRAIQGLGSGPIHSLSSIIIHDLLPIRMTGKFLGLTGIVVALSVVGGPAFGGLIADQGKNYWRIIFYVDIAVGVITCTLLGMFLKYEKEREERAAEMEAQAMKAIHHVVIEQPKDKEILGDAKVVLEKDAEKAAQVDGVQVNVKRSKRRIAARIDYLGPFLLISSIILCLVSSSLASDGTLNWGDIAVVSMLTIGGIFFVLFIAIEIWVAPEPAIPIRTFLEQPSVFLALLTKFFQFFILVAIVSFVPVYYQKIQGDSASIAGLKTLPIMLSFIFGSVPAGVLLTWLGVAWPFPIIGTTIVTISLGLLTTFHYNAAYLLIAFYLSILGLGLGISNQAVSVLLVAPLKRELHSNILSTMQFMQNAGGVVGVQCFQVALQTILGRHLEGHVDADVHKLDRDTILSLPQTEQLDVYQVYSFAYQVMFWITVPLSIVTFLLVLPLYRVRVPEMPEEKPESMPTSH